MKYCDYDHLNDVVDYIVNEMNVNKNARVTAQIAELNAWSGLDFITLSNPLTASYTTSKKSVHKVKAMYLWYHMVKSGADWDHKKYIFDNFDEWTCNKSNPAKKYNFDIWSNVHYGYIGKCCGFEEWTLLSVAQIKDGTSEINFSWENHFYDKVEFDFSDINSIISPIPDFDIPTYFDDPKDNHAIQIGFRLYNKYNSTLTRQNLLDELNNAETYFRPLSTAPCEHSH